MSDTLQVLQNLRSVNLREKAQYSSAFTWAINAAISIYIGGDPNNDVVKLVEHCLREAREKQDREAA